MYNRQENSFFADPDASAAPEEVKKDEDMENEKEKKKEVVNDAEQQKKAMNAILSKKFMNYPTNSGISGEVFLNQKLFFSNNASKESKFVEEIDDQS